MLEGGERCPAPADFLNPSSQFSLIQVAEFSVLVNADLPDFLSKPRPEWAKVRWRGLFPSRRSAHVSCAQIRWLHVNGLSWDVIRTLALQYDLHPLSLEDMVSSTPTSAPRVLTLSSRPAFSASTRQHLERSKQSRLLSPASVRLNRCSQSHFGDELGGRL